MSYQAETQIGYRIRKLTAEERAELCALMGISGRTLTRWANEPGRLLTGDEMEQLCSYLETLDGMDYDRTRMLEPITLPGTPRRRKQRKHANAA